MNARTVIAVIAVIAVVGVGAVVYYVNRPAAEEASIENALTALDPTGDAAVVDGAVAAEEDGADAAAAGEGDAAAGDEDEAAATPGEAADTDGVDDVSGTWSVDTAIGEFDFADATSTFAGFRVAEELQTVGQTEAVGRTPAVDGQLTIEGTTVTAAAIEADFTAIVSDVPRRDDAMRRAMGVASNPSSTFTLTDPIDVGDVPAEGETITFTALGDLTVNGVTNPVEFDMEAQVAGGNLLVVGRAPVVFADYDITAPQAGPVVAIDDHGTIELQLWFTRA